MTEIEFIVMMLLMLSTFVSGLLIGSGMTGRDHQGEGY